MLWLLIGALVVLGLMILFWILALFAPKRTRSHGFTVGPDGIRHEWKEK